MAAQFGGNLRRLRKEAGVTQADLGKRSGLARAEIGMLEQGARLARVDTLMKLARGLDVDPAALLNRLDVLVGD